MPFTSTRTSYSMSPTYETPIISPIHPSVSGFTTMPWASLSPSMSKESPDLKDIPLANSLAIRPDLKRSSRAMTSCWPSAER